MLIIDLHLKNKKKSCRQQLPDIVKKLWFNISLYMFHQ